MIKAWAVIIFYFNGSGLQTTEVSNIASQAECERLAARWNKAHTWASADFAHCYPTIEVSPSMQIIFPEPTKVEK